jgi:hypothetical protein
MKRLLPFFFFFFLSIQMDAGVISGHVHDESGESLIGANIYIKETYDGATSDIDGFFQFETSETGDQVLIISFIGFKTIEKAIDVHEILEFDITMIAAFNAINAVTITAGVFEASDEKKAVVLSSLDVAMTAGASADIAGALTTLPGTQKNAQDGRLFVRGGSAEETKVYIDGVEAANFYGTTGQNLPTRGRFSPFLFKGTYFSTGGYSAEYGQALSSALILKSKDVELNSRYDISIMSVGLDASTVQAKDDRSFYAKVGFTDLSSYNAIVSQRIEWEASPRSLDAIFSWKQDFDDGSKLRSLGMLSRNTMHFIEPTVLNESGTREIDITNDFGFFQITYEKPLSKSDFISVGISGTANDDSFDIDQTVIDSRVNHAHIKFKWDHTFNAKVFLKSGVDIFQRHFLQNVMTDEAYVFEFDQTRIASYAELDYYFNENIVVRAGLRLEQDNYLADATASPRLSVAYKLNDVDQFSFATGRFFQDPQNDYLKFVSELSQERADHYMFNFQRVKEKTVFRVEAYLKDYKKLISYEERSNASTFGNEGYGYAYGMDVFWRNRGGVKNIDYWVTYSYLKSERKYLDYNDPATPSFATNHNISIVAKRWFSRLKTQIGMTYSFSSGRPYDHPERQGFNESRTRAFHDLSYNMAWLPNRNLIMYLSVNNVLGLEQIFGYEFSETPNNQGTYQVQTQRMPAPRILFLGCFITLGQYNDQLENL